MNATCYVASDASYCRVSAKISAEKNLLDIPSPVDHRQNENPFCFDGVEYPPWWNNDLAILRDVLSVKFRDYASRFGLFV